MIERIRGGGTFSHMTPNRLKELLETLPSSSLDKAFDFYLKAIKYNIK